MKKFRTILFFMLILKSIVSLSQAPFTTLVKEPRFLIKKTGLVGNEKFIQTDSTTYINSLTEDSSKVFKSEKNDIDFFSNNSLSLSLLSKGDNRTSINSKVLHYKLFFANPNENNKYRINRYNIPLLVITKLSSNYDSTNSSGAIDMLDYEAAPLTLRIMPSFRKSFITYNDVFYYGFYADIRGLNMYDATNQDYEIEIVGSGGFGITYQGDGQAGTFNENGEYSPGRYSISIILQGAVGDKNIINRMFKTENNYVTALQSYFLFKVSEKSHLNIKIGYQYFFQETISGNKSHFSVALGI